MQKIKRANLCKISSFFINVGVERFELPTPWSQTRYTNRTVLHPVDLISSAKIEQLFEFATIGAKNILTKMSINPDKITQLFDNSIFRSEKKVSKKCNYFLPQTGQFEFSHPNLYFQSTLKSMSIAYQSKSLIFAYLFRE